MNGSRRASKKSTAAKQSPSRRVSTSTTAPIAPRTRSSHINQNRSCPGVPNRYKIRSRSSVIRPKSIATVVVVLALTCAVSSTPSDAVVSAASVVSGMISETAPTKVVLPTPNPPAMTILTGVGARSEVGLDLDRAESIQHPLEKSEVGAVADLCGAVHLHQALFGHVADQYAGDAERQVKPRRSEEHTSGLQSRRDLVCRLLL